MSGNNHKFNLAGVLVALGIVFGDIGTSPLYVMKAIVGERLITEDLVLGGFSCVFWTLTLITTFKYVLLALQADNRGEGGIFALFALVRRNSSWLIYPAMIGGSALLADGIITPCISVSSAIEGLKVNNPDLNTVPIVILILFVLFAMQQLGTNKVGKSFGPIVTVWFLMLTVLGIDSMLDHPQVLKGFNPYYAINLLINHEHAFWILGAVFLCTTGAEALYSDLGHCGKRNIQVSWIYVKIALLINYAGQASFLLGLEGKNLNSVNPFYAIMPEWFLNIGIIIATIAAIVASQAIISGVFTLVTEAMRLSLFPRMKVVYPTELRGQIYVPAINFLMLVGCIGVVLYFHESSHMEAAYGLAISLNLIMTTTLLSYFLIKKRVNTFLVWLFTCFYLIIEGAFLAANSQKIFEGGWVAIFLGMIIFALMWVWMSGNIIKKRFIEFNNLSESLPLLNKLSSDTSVSKFSTHLVYLTEAVKSNKIEQKILHSLFKRQPKRADVYWFIHVDVVDEPYTQEYKVTTLIPKTAFRIDFKLGFRIEPRISVFFREVINELSHKGEVDVISRYESLRGEKIPGDFRFVISRKYLSAENDLSFYDALMMKAYFYLKHIIGFKEASGFGLDTSSVIIENFPLLITPPQDVELKRVYD